MNTTEHSSDTSGENIPASDTAASEASHRFLLQTTALLRHLLTESVKYGNAIGVGPMTQRDRLIQALETQLATLKAIEFPSQLEK
jgi:hypothetical protein